MVSQYGRTQRTSTSTSTLMRCSTESFRRPELSSISNRRVTETPASARRKEERRRVLTLRCSRKRLSALKRAKRSRLVSETKTWKRKSG